MYDTHCHPYLSEKKSQNTILETFFKNWWKYLNSIWIDLDSSKKCIELTKKYKWVYATAGIHPSYVKNYIWKEEKILKKLEEFIQEKKVIWIWECWLDYYWIDKNNLEKEKRLQKEFFIQQIYLAKKYKLPLIIHNREAKEDIFDILKKENFKNFIVHCFSENLEFAQKCIDFSPNCKISFSGIVTFKNAQDVQETAKSIPLKNIIIETDSPYLTPTPHRWREENEPIFVKHILEKIVELREENKENIEKQILKNSLDFFNFNSSVF